MFLETRSWQKARVPRAEPRIGLFSPVVSRYEFFTETWVLALIFLNLSVLKSDMEVLWTWYERWAVLVWFKIFATEDSVGILLRHLLSSLFCLFLSHRLKQACIFERTVVGFPAGFLYLRYLPAHKVWQIIALSTLISLRRHIPVPVFNYLIVFGWVKNWFEMVTRADPRWWLNIIDDTIRHFTCISFIRIIWKRSNPCLCAAFIMF